MPGKVQSPGRETVQEMIEESKENPLRIPSPDAIRKKELVDVFAPIFIQDMAASYDRLGEVRWKNHRIEVNPEKPTVYYYFSHALLRGNPSFKSTMRSGIQNVQETGLRLLKKVIWMD